MDHVCTVNFEAAAYIMEVSGPQRNSKGGRVASGAQNRSGSGCYFRQAKPWYRNLSRNSTPRRIEGDTKFLTAIKARSRRDIGRRDAIGSASIAAW